MTIKEGLCITLLHLKDCQMYTEPFCSQYHNCTNLTEEEPKFTKIKSSGVRFLKDLSEKEHPGSKR
jgi:hypothetical protein